MALAAELSQQTKPDTGTLSSLLLKGLRELEPRLILNGEGASRHPGILNLYFPGISAEELAVRLDLMGICVSPGAACGARDPKPSHVLLSMGCSEPHARGSLRFSLGRNTTEEEIRLTLSALDEILRHRKEP